MLFLESTPKEEEEEEGTFEALEAQVLCLSGVVRDNSAEFLRHVHGSHVVRTLLHVLAGCIGPPRTEARAGTPRNTWTIMPLVCWKCSFSCADTRELRQAEPHWDKTRH